MWRVWVVMTGAVLLFVGGASQASAQVMLHLEQQRAEERANAQITYLQDRMRCQAQFDSARRPAWGEWQAYPVGVGPAVVDRETILREAELQYHECLTQLDLEVVRQTCRDIARTDAQRARCEQ